ncbi:DNA-binding protein [Saliterribacillus persicus]|uniref:DNA-binding protein n=1 Tax=Saliterribacillus persicus TaxID=930114 RepID=A0A368YB65_9BACI|nr:DNA-binding protein [Saliterribacillus persicus]RCW76939.1 hypothetical protein DFR57_102214 [Saliterribacillus persicus]
MEFDFFWIAIGLAAAGYFIGEGLKHFKNPEADSILDEFDDEDDEFELIKEKYLHYYIGIAKEDIKAFTEKYPDIPHITVNNNKYYPKEKLRKWMEQIGE